MQPGRLELLGVRGNNNTSYRRSPSIQDHSAMSPVPSVTGRLRSEDSWVDISSQPSSSSLSSVGDNDMITAGLQIRHQHNDNFRPRRRRRPHPTTSGESQLPARSSSAGGSSQEEYDESESESEQISSSSTEDVTTSHRGMIESRPSKEVENDDEEEDDDSTALGTRSSFTNDKAFIPQPNAFSHPPLSQTSRMRIRSTPAPSSYFPTTSSTDPAATRGSGRHVAAQRDSQPKRPQLLQPHTRRSRSSCNFIGPSHAYQPDHDAALRASLSTLLSCAAAVRGSPKQQDVASRNDVRQPNEPTSLRLVPETELYGNDDRQAPPLPPRKYRARSPPPSPTSLSAKATAKRKARGDSSKDRLSNKKSRATRPMIGSDMDETTISPILMSWMISAGFVLVFSAISFSVGYAWGREVGKLEAGAMGIGGGGDNAACGKEAIKSGSGLRRLRWGSASTAIRV